MKKIERHNHGRLTNHLTSFFPYSIFPVNYTYPIDNLETEESVLIMEKGKIKAIEGGYPEDENTEVIPLTKKEFSDIVSRKKEEFVHEHFSHRLRELFVKLREDALMMRTCHHEVTFECPNHFNIDVTQSILRDYFKNLGFETVAMPQKEKETIITLTLT